MFSVRKAITIPFDFTTRFATNFVYKISKIKSNSYFVVLRNDEELHINAKSILGIMSANIVRGENIIVIADNVSQQQAENDLCDICKLIMNNIDS